MPALFLALLLLAGPAAAAPPERIAEAERAIEGEDYPAAGRILNDLAASRAPGPLTPDPLLSGLQGRLLARRAPPPVALAYLQYADSENVPAQQRVAALFALAETREAVGDRRRAAEAYGKLQSLKLNDREQWRARLGASRSRLPDAPRDTLDSARALAASGEPASRWEAELLLAEASLLLGDRAGARQAADRAWAESAEAPPGAFAPQRVATFLAALAAAEDRRAAVLAGLTAAGGTRQIDPAMAESLPICGMGKLEPSDWVTFTAFADLEHGRWLAPVSASRPGAIAPFTDAIAGLNLFADKPGLEAPGGMVFTTRCRTAPSIRYRPAVREADPMPLWFASRGLLIPFVGDELADINRLSGRIEELARARPDDPGLIPMRIALATALRERAGVSPDVEPWQITQLEKQAKEAIRRIGDDQAFPFELSEIFAQPPQDAAEAATLITRMGPAVAAYMNRAPLDFAYEMALRFFAGEQPFDLDLRRGAIEALSGRFAERSDDPRRLSLLLILAEMHRGDEAMRRKRWRATGLPLDLCRAGDEPPTMAEHHISDSDFPKDLLRFGLAGNTVFEITVTADGKAKDGRIILSAPSRLFEPAFEAKLPNFEMRPMQSGGRPRECRGYTQRILWKFPEADGNPMPDFSMPAPPTF